ncbi:DUF2497 domain-containing protein [Anderseniella sp. Alg231-50]|uniref:DUF2497 domain-containing protein n=1 Tax=Anderseniella sp. Alg231-50 TaxID=1922226 RepID=UPI000D54B1AE
MQIMGKQDSKPPDGHSVDQLLSSIREAIEQDTANEMAVPVKSPLKPIGAPRAPRPGPEPSEEQQAVSAPVAPSAEPQTSEGDEKHGPGYVSNDPYRYRHSLETSPSYMSLRNRLASLKSRTRSGTSRSMASLLGGDVRQEEARARDQQQQLQSSEASEATPETDVETGLRTSIGDEQAYVDEFITGDVSSGVVSYTPDYSDWKIENPLASVVPPEADGAQQDMAVPLVSTRQVTVDDLVEIAAGGEAVAEADAVADEVPEPEMSSEDTESEPGLPLEEMIRQVIEPELVIWIDKHLPDQVASAMPSEEAFTAMIRPMIEQWLADNLSPIVEVAVREEIARITGLKR